MRRCPTRDPGARDAAWEATGAGSIKNDVVPTFRTGHKGCMKKEEGAIVEGNVKGLQSSIRYAYMQGYDQ